MTSAARSPEPIRTQVLIVGGGPVGLATAMELVLHGIDCVVVEARPTVSATRPRAKTTSVRTMELFRRWSFADEIRKRAPIPVGWSSDIVFCTTVTGREITRLTGVLGLDLVDSDLAAEPGQQVAQPVVEQALRETLAGSRHCRLLLGRQVLSVEEAGDTARGLIGGDGPEPTPFRADFVVGADGARSLVRAAMGAVYAGGNAGLPNLSVVFRSLGLAGHIVGAPALHHWVLNPDAPGVVGPLDMGGTWWAIATGQPADDSAADPAAIVRALVGREIPVEVLGTTRGRLAPCWSTATDPAGCSSWATPRTRTLLGVVTASTPVSATRSTSVGSSPPSFAAGRRPNCSTATSPSVARWRSGP